MTNRNSEFQTVQRRRARSGNTEYSRPLTLDDTSKRRINILPHYIKHNSGKIGVTVTVTVWIKHKDRSLIDEKRSFNLSEISTNALLEGLTSYFKIADEPNYGDYVLIPLSEGTVNFKDHNPLRIVKALIKILEQSDVIKHFQNTELSTQLTATLKSAIRINEIKLAVAELREMLETGKNDERFYQFWCEKHTWAFGNAYVMRDKVREITPGDRVDIMLSNATTGYRDIIELKRPDVEVLKYDSDRRNFYFSSHVSKSVGQCHRYLDVLHEVAAKRGFNLSRVGPMLGAWLSNIPTRSLRPVPAVVAPTPSRTATCAVAHADAARPAAGAISAPARAAIPKRSSTKPSSSMHRACR